MDTFAKHLNASPHGGEIMCGSVNRVQFLDRNDFEALNFKLVSGSRMVDYLKVPHFAFLYFFP